MNTVLITTYNRPEFLHHCLRNIEKAAGSEYNHYHFAVDFGHKPEILKVIEEFPLRKSIVIRKKYVLCSLTKQSFNVLKGYQEAVDKSDGLVYLIEEDVMIANDFFVFHERAHAAEPEAFCVIGNENTNRKIDVGDAGFHDYYKTTYDYCSLGVSFRKDILKKYVLKHLNIGYLSTPMLYVKKNFPPGSIGGAFCEQDGLIRRIQHETGLPIIYPYVARSFHAGFYGKNRGRYEYFKDINHAIKKINSVIYSTHEMKRITGGGAFYEDSKPINLDNNLNYSLTFKTITV